MTAGTAANARTISSLAGDAWQHLQKASSDLDKAVRLAEAEGGASGNRLRNCLGALRILKTEVSGQQLAWSDFARVREGTDEK